MIERIVRLREKHFVGLVEDTLTANATHVALLSLIMARLTVLENSK